LPESIEKEIDMTTQEQVYYRVIQFMKDNHVTCEDSIYQCDWIIENAYEFIGDLFNIVEPELELEE
jgi:hypothetical protein